MPDLLSLIPRRKNDLKAHTIGELCDLTGYDRSAITRMRDAGLKKGEWIQVWKKPKGGKWQKAYRAKIG